MPRTACGRWSSSDASDTAACRRSSARRRCRRTASFAPSASAARRGAHGIVCRPTPARDVDAYLAGVNAFIATHHGRQLPPEFSLLRFEPEPWTGPDVLVWVKMMAWDLSANYSSELLRHDLLDRVGPGQDRAAAAALSGRRPHHRARRRRHARAAARHRKPGIGARVQPSTARARTPGPRLSARAVRPATRPVRDFLLGGATDRGARLEQLGGRRHADRQRQTAARQRSAPRDPHSLAVVSGAPLGRRLRRHRRHPAGRTRRRHRPQSRTSRGARPTSPPTCRISIASGSNQAGDAAEFRGAFEPLRFIDEEIKVKGDRRRSTCRCASRATGRWSRTRSTPTTPRRRRRQAGADRAARLSLDGARRRRPHASSRFSS